MIQTRFIIIMVMSIVLTAVSTTARTATSSAFTFSFARRQASQAKQKHRVTASPALGMSFLDDMTSSLQRSFSSLSSPSKYYTVGITGASGLLGTALIDELKAQETLYGKPVRIVKLTRSNNIDKDTTNTATTDLDFGTSSTITIPWNPKATDPSSVLNLDMLSQMDAIVHLAGENVATGLGPLGFLGIRPWTADKKREILDSRVGPTQALAKAIAAASSSSSKTTTKIDFIVASGVGVYGSDYFKSTNEDDDDTVTAAADEQMDISKTTGFLADVSRQWEAAAAPPAGASSSKIRVVNCRMGVVLSKNGGALGKLYPIFFLGGGGIVGSGNQYFSFISARDASRALVHILSSRSDSILGSSSSSGSSSVINICAPVPCTNAEFTSAMGKVLNRPTILPLPGFIVSLAFGEMGEEMLLGGVKAVPTKLLKSGFKFQHETIEEALHSAVTETI